MFSSNFFNANHWKARFFKQTGSDAPVAVQTIIATVITRSGITTAVTRTGITTAVTKTGAITVKDDGTHG